MTVKDRLLFRYPLFREVFSCSVHENPEGRKRKIVPQVQFLCIAKRVTENGVNSNKDSNPDHGCLEKKVPNISMWCYNVKKWLSPVYDIG